MSYLKKEKQCFYSLIIALETKKLVLLRSVLGVSFRAAAEPCNSQNNVQSVLLQPVCASV